VAHDRLASRPIPPPEPGRIAIVGPCAAGKTTLATALRALGYEVRHCLQEHSHVADMWQRISRPQVLIYLDVSHQRSLLRKANGPGTAEWQAQQLRLAHARRHCTLYIDTDPLSIEQVYQRALATLEALGVRP
jgi:guanylate kinase